MNANIQRAMEIALEMNDKEQTIEGIKQELDDLEAELKGLFGHKPKAQSRSRSKPGKSARYTSRENYGSGGFARPLILDAMKGGLKLTIDEIHKRLKQPLKKSTMHSTLAKMTANGLIKRVGPGKYQLAAKGRKQFEAGASPSRKPVALSKRSKVNGMTLPRGYWKKAILKAMPVGKKMATAEILRKIDVPKDKKNSATVAISTLGKQGVLKKVRDGFYLNPGSKKPPTTPARAPRKPPRRTVKNFKVKTLTKEQERFLEKQQPGSTSAEILKMMKHGKEYTIDQIAGRIDPNKGKSTYRSTLHKLLIIGFVERPRKGVYIRV